MKQDLKDYFSRIGKRGGQVVSPAKIAACKRNAKLPRKKGGRPVKRNVASKSSARPGTK